MYFSEEFFYARDLGYRIIPLRGYLKPSPFESFVSSLFEQEENKAGNKAMAYVYVKDTNELTVR